MFSFIIIDKLIQLTYQYSKFLLRNVRNWNIFIHIQGVEPKEKVQRKTTKYSAFKKDENRVLHAPNYRRFTDNRLQFMSLFSIAKKLLPLLFLLLSTDIKH